MFVTSLPASAAILFDFRTCLLAARHKQKILKILVQPIREEKANGEHTDTWKYGYISAAGEKQGKENWSSLAVLEIILRKHTQHTKYTV